MFNFNEACACVLENNFNIEFRSGPAFKKAPQHRQGVRHRSDCRGEVQVPETRSWLVKTISIHEFITSTQAELRLKKIKGCPTSICTPGCVKTIMGDQQDIKFVHSCANSLSTSPGTGEVGSSGKNFGEQDPRLSPLEYIFSPRNHWQ